MPNENKIFAKKHISILEKKSSVVEDVILDATNMKDRMASAVVPLVNNYDHHNGTMHGILVHNSTDDILNNNNMSVPTDTDPNYATLTIIVWIIAFFMCVCAKPNVPDASYRRYPNGVPIMKKKKEIDPEDRKKLIETKMTTKEVTGQSESGEIILNEHQNNKDTINHEDGTRIVVESYSNEENNILDDDNNNDNDNKNDDLDGKQEAQGRTDDNDSVCSSHFSLVSDDVNGIMCMICLEPFQEGELVSWSTEMKCRHIFHKDCIHPWLLNHEDCPSCRGPLLPENYEDSPDPQDEQTVAGPTASEEEEDYNGPYIIDFNGLIFRASERVRRSFVESVRRLSIVSSTDGSVSSSSCSCKNSSTNEPQKPPPKFIDIEQQTWAETSSSDDDHSSSLVNQKTQSCSCCSNSSKMPSDIFRKGKEMFQNKVMKQLNSTRRINHLHYNSVMGNRSHKEEIEDNGNIIT